MVSREKKFWMVVNPNRGNPTYRHQSEASARDEAERLAKMNPNETFIVLESVAEVKVTNFFWTEHQENVPF